MNITVCPPSPERPNVHFDKTQFSVRHAYPVEAKFVGGNNGINGWESNGISFGDYQSMSTQKHKQKHDRRLPTPAYMQDEKTFRAVMLRYLEYRIGGCRCRAKCEGAEIDRARRVAERSKIRVEMELKRLDAYSHEYVALRTASTYGVDVAKRLRWLECQIACTDTCIRILREPWVIPQICRAYYFEGLGSRDVASRTGLTPCNVRQTLRRISILAERMAAGEDVWSRRPAAQSAA